LGRHGVVVFGALLARLRVEYGDSGCCVQTKRFAAAVSNYRSEVDRRKYVALVVHNPHRRLLLRPIVVPNLVGMIDHKGRE